MNIFGDVFTMLVMIMLAVGDLGCYFSAGICKLPRYLGKRACGIVVSMFDFHCSNRGSNLVEAVNFHNDFPPLDCSV